MKVINVYGADIEDVKVKLKELYSLLDELNKKIAEVNISLKDIGEIKIQIIQIDENGETLNPKNVL